MMTLKEEQDQEDFFTKILLLQPATFSRTKCWAKEEKKEYVTEVKTISQLRHRNLVQLLGCCHDRGEFLLVYEFMPNGSLDGRLFGKKSPLAWAVRYIISLGLATALLYLHEEWEQCVVHRDTKSSKIMLNLDVEIWTSQLLTG
ncbi:hypothetical protein KPL70_019951 [Citrus sinensis]|nr:hypothetical protein KPL70_019951 [Citrus sinensis]